jgi:hypothetical protein
VAYPTFDSKGNLIQASGYNAATGQGIYLDSAGKAVKAAVARPDATIGQLNVNKSVGHSRASMLVRDMAIRERGSVPFNDSRNLLN